MIFEVGGKTMLGVIAIALVAGIAGETASVAGTQSSPTAIDAQAAATQAAEAIRKLSPLPDPNMGMRGVISVRHGDKIAFCGEILGTEFPVHYAGYVRFISFNGSAELESPTGAYTTLEQFGRDWNNLCEPS
jgi:hypothetical protein